METLQNDFIINQKLIIEDYNHFPKSENELMKYFSEFSVEFFECGCELPKKILEVIHSDFKSYLNSEIHVTAISNDGRKGKLTFISKNLDEKFIYINWSELEVVKWVIL